MTYWLAKVVSHSRYVIFQMAEVAVPWLAKVVSHSRYVIFQMAEVAVPQTLFWEILGRIRRLRFLAIPASPG